jgi:hypothetical protein
MPVNNAKQGICGGADGRKFFRGRKRDIFSCDAPAGQRKPSGGSSMKKIFILLVLALSLAACNPEGEPGTYVSFWQSYGTLSYKYAIFADGVFEMTTYPNNYFSDPPTSAWRGIFEEVDIGNPTLGCARVTITDWISASDPTRTWQAWPPSSGKYFYFTYTLGEYIISIYGATGCFGYWNENGAGRPMGYDEIAEVGDDINDPNQGEAFTRANVID